MDVGTVGLVVVASQPSVLSVLSCLGNGAFGFGFTNLTGARPFTATALPKRGAGAGYFISAVASSGIFSKSK